MMVLVGLAVLLVVWDSKINVWSSSCFTLEAGSAPPPPPRLLLVLPWL